MFLWVSYLSFLLFKSDEITCVKRAIKGLINDLRLSIKSDIVLLMSNVEQGWLPWPVLVVSLDLGSAYVLGG